jgi:hypothetical protein
MKMKQIECSETSAYKIQTPGNYPDKTYNIQKKAKFEIKKYTVVDIAACWAAASLG